MKEHRVMEHLQQEIEQALQGMTEQEQAWLLAHLRALCWRKMMSFSKEVRHAAELDATSPLQLLRKSHL